VDRVRRWQVWQLFTVLHRGAPGMARGWWALVVLRGALPAGFAVAMGRLVTDVQDGRSLTGGLVLVGVLFVAMQSLGPLHDALSANLGATTSSWLHDRLLDACLGPPGLAHLEDPELADRLSTARDFDLGLSGPSLPVTVPQIGGGLAALVGGFAQAALLTGYAWWAPLLVGGAWASTHVLLRGGAMWLGRTSPEVMEQQRKADYAFRLAVHNPAAKELRLFGLGQWVVGGFTTLRRHLMEQSWADRRLRWRPTWLALVLIVAANAVFFSSLARSAGDGGVGVGSLVVFAQAAIGASALAFGEFDWWLRTAAQPVPLVLDLVEQMAAAGALPSGTADATGHPAEAIRFEGVGFAYPRAGHRVFDGFDLTIPAGHSLAVVGQNGAGKTTMAKLLCRMYDPDAGRITVDGTDLRDFDLASWRARVAAVFQDYVRYELSLRDNVAPGGAGDDVVRAALADARAEHLADLDTVLAKGYEGGTDLSGGQWQRVALARALASVRLGAGVVILDEPTAQLDVRGEAEIFERLIEATRGCTTILISHRFSTVRRADRICVIEHGRVVEQGSHDELVASGGRYKAMFELQASRFDDEPDLETLAPG
jgi:ABC-type transport system involved in cytochrome bd biosynthesis fused ATPase/permease subunit